MKYKKKILLFLVLFFCIITRAIIALPLDNKLIPGGTDTSGHLYLVWYATEKGIDKWSFYTNGGETIFRLNPPLSHIIAGVIGNFTGFLFAYKLVFDIFFVITPIVFFYFLKEFNLSNEKIMIALVIFSLFPTHSYYFADARFPSIVNLPIIMLYWIFLKRAIDSKSLSDLLIPAIILSISVLIHNTTAFIGVVVTFAWVIHSKRLKIFYKLFKLFLLSITTFLLLMLWSIPLIETLENTEGGGYKELVKTPNPIALQENIIFRIMNLDLFSTSFGPYIIIIFGITVSLYLLFSLTSIKEKITQNFLLIFLVIVVLILIIDYKRAFIFLPIPLSVLIVQGISEFKKLRLILFLIILLISIVAFYSIIPWVFSYPEYPDIPRDGRVIFLPRGADFQESPEESKNVWSHLLAPMNENENILTWNVIALNTTKKTFFPTVAYTPKKIQYNGFLADPLSINRSKYYTLLKNGHVNYIAVNKNYQNSIDYFDHKKFKLINETKLFKVFEIVPKSSYVEMNGNKVDARIKKGKDKISIEMECTPGNITVKESYNKNWIATLNGEKVNIKENEYSFMNIGTDFRGECSLKFTFQDPDYYFIFKFISFATWLFAVIILIKLKVI